MAGKVVGITWRIGDQSGWEVFGLNLTLHLMRDKRFSPLLLCGADFRGSTKAAEEITPVLEASQKVMAPLAGMPAATVGTFRDAVLLHGLGNDLLWGNTSESFRGGRDVAITFFERTTFSREAIARAHSFDLILAGSSWNQHVLKAIGLKNVALGLQGIDTNLFHPRPRSGRFGERFVVFSGGKVEIRKGQDLVLAAFRAFRERHPDALLVTAWQSPWSSICAPEMSMSRCDVGVPNIDPTGRLDAVEWAVRNGIPADSIVDLGFRDSADMADILADVDLALFPNRAEGGTNLVAMEAMACGVPSLLSANTGHMDLIRDDNCYPLYRQGPVTSMDNSTTDWGETSIDEMVAAMEFAYQNRDETIQRGRNAARFMADWDWSSAVGRMVAEIEKIL